MSGNRIFRIPDTLPIGLKTLKITYNLFESLPISLTRLSNLETFLYDGLMIRTPPNQNVIQWLYHNINSECKYGDACAICLEEMKLDEEYVVTLNKCKHQFHYECIIEYIQHSTHQMRFQNRICPICRAKMTDRIHPYFS